ncbi:MAG: hypothetical protein ACRES4_10385, partial [Nevskiales bacterium]
MTTRRFVPLLLLIAATAAAGYGAWRWLGPSPAAETAGEAFAVVGVSERSLDGRPALAILFNAELKASR